MTTVQAVRIHQFGGPEVLRLEDVAVGEPGPGEVRIRHHACGLNYIDVYHRSGQYPNPLPLVPGVEGAGIVEAVGEGVSHLQPGDRAAYASQMPGAYSQARVMPARNVVPLPVGIAFDTAAGMMLKGLTVQYLLKQTLPQGGLQPGDSVLFHAVAGGVGLIACQWARALGLQLIGTAGGEEKCRLALTNGAAHAIDYRREDFVARVKEITGGRGVKVVYDAVGRDTFDHSLDCLQPLGLMVLFGSSSGPVAPLDLGRLAAKGSLHVTRPTVFTHLATQEKTLAMAQDLFSVVLGGQVNVRMGQVYPLSVAPRAHRDLESRSTTGSNVLLP